jgi:orotate phosphoribosyltransferase
MGARHGHVEYESGHHGTLWLDLDGLFLRPERLVPYVEALAALLAGYGVEVVCGPLVGGAYVAQAVGPRLDADCVHTTRTAAGYVLPPALAPRLAGRRVAIVDDVINAGSAVGSTLTAVGAAGGTPVAVGALLHLGTTASAVAGDLPLLAVATLPNPLWSVPECPLCTDGVPVRIGG